jgi:hypothetical protein
LNYHDIFSTNPLTSNFTKIHLVGAGLFRAGREMDGLTDRHDEAKLKLNSVALVRERTIPTERPPPVGEVSANFCG